MSDAYLIPDLLQLLVINDTDCVLKDLFISNNYLEKVIFEIDDNVSYRSNFRPLCKQIVQCFTGFGFQKKKRNKNGEYLFMLQKQSTYAKIE